MVLQGQEAGVPSVLWQHRLGGSSDEAWQGVCVSSDGGIVVCGYTASADGDAADGKGGTDAWVVRFSAQGELIWKKRFGGSKLDFANSVINAEGGGFIVAGVSYSNDGDVSGNHGYSDAWVLKLSDQGEKEWSYLYGGECFEEAVSVQTSTAGGYLIAGASCSSGNMFPEEYKGLYDGFLFYIRNDGALIWQHHFGGSMNDYFFHVDQSEQGDWMVAGETFSGDGDLQHNNGQADAWLACVTSSGTLKWSQTYGGPGNDRFFNVHCTGNGNLIASGYIQRDYDFDAWAIKANHEGVVLKEQSYGASGSDYFVGASLTEEGGVLFCGAVSRATDGISGLGTTVDGWILKTDSSLQLEWQFFKGGEETDAFVGITTYQNRIYLSGFTSSESTGLPAAHGMQDTWVVVLKNDLVNGVPWNEMSSSVKIYPNPVHESGQFVLSYSQSSMVQHMFILSASGEVLRSYNQVRNGQLISVAGLPSGSYWIKMIDSRGKISFLTLVVQ